MDNRIKSFVTDLHNSPSMAVIAITGAGSWAIPWLQTVPGASRSLLDIRLPYSENALEEFFKCPSCGGVLNLKKNEKLQRAFAKQIDKIRKEMQS